MLLNNAIPNVYILYDKNALCTVPKYVYISRKRQEQIAWTILHIIGIHQLHPEDSIFENP